LRAASGVSAAAARTLGKRFAAIARPIPVLPTSTAPWIRPSAIASAAALAISGNSATSFEGKLSVAQPSRRSTSVASARRIRAVASPPSPTVICPEVPAMLGTLPSFTTSSKWGMAWRIWSRQAR